MSKFVLVEKIWTGSILCDMPKGTHAPCGDLLAVA